MKFWLGEKLLSGGEKANWLERGKQIGVCVGKFFVQRESSSPAPHQGTAWVIKVHKWSPLSGDMIMTYVQVR